MSETANNKSSRTLVRGSILKFIQHIHPVKIQTTALSFYNTWGLGGMALVLFFLLVSSGSLMLFVYKPFPELAYDSVLQLQNDYIFGTFIRNIHYFSANFLVIIVFLHMLRVFLTGGYFGVRKINWMIGILIFCLVLSSCFTGYLLPWDQVAFWAITISINILDYIPAGEILKQAILHENEVTSKTLQLFFTFHTTIIPAILIPILGVHFWKIRKAKGVVTSTSNRLSEDKKPAMIDTMPHLILREIVVGLVLIAFVMTVSTRFTAPLEVMANAGLSPNPAKAPWYFAGLQELLLHFHPFFAVFLIPLVIFFLLISLPYFQTDESIGGLWFLSEKGKKTSIVSFISGAILTPALIVIDEHFINAKQALTDIPPWLSTGLFPVLLVAALLLIFIVGIKKKFDLNQAETIQALITILITVYITLMYTGVWFRGESMKLMWPW